MSGSTSVGNYVNSQHISGFLFTKYLLNYTIMLNICHLGRLLKLLTHLARRKLIEELQVRAKLLTPSRNLKVVVLFCYCLVTYMFTHFHPRYFESLAGQLSGVGTEIWICHISALYVCLCLCLLYAVLWCYPISESQTILFGRHTAPHVE